ncbi:glycosyl hydrolase family 28-related protein [Burkholderia gladioli]|uniref:glycosyl hydrolase family 28-related protein n=1 Tax=Burkholderia gladioli TaxID=28095 RepID=UPI001640D2A1|nr:glycosyl hydrolase family 28-related protein [Burkholderia gladioli]
MSRVGARAVRGRLIRLAAMLWVLAAGQVHAQLDSTVTQRYSGAFSRSISDKLQDTVSILDFPGCDRTGRTDSTGCIQAALHSGAKSVYVPAGRYRQSGLVLPQLTGFTLYGDGPNSVLIQTGGSIRYPEITRALNFDSHATIRDLSFDGTEGRADTLDTSYSQTLDLLNLSFRNVPINHVSVRLDGNPRTATYMHDVRIKNIRVYSTTAGLAGILLGPHASDSTIDGFQMDGGFAVKYALLAEPGAQTTMLQNSHPYNAAINVIHLDGTGNFSFLGNVIDNSIGDVIDIRNSANTRIASTWIESINSRRRGLVFDHSSDSVVLGLNCSTNGIRDAEACVAEINGADQNRIFGAQVDSESNYARPFDLTGASSFFQAVNSGNALNIAGASARQSPSLNATGSDASIPVTLKPKGGGAVQLELDHRATMAMYSDRASEVAIDAYDAVNPLAKLNMNLAKYGGRVLLGGTDDGASKLQVEGDARIHGDIFATGVGALPVYRASGAALAAAHVVAENVMLRGGGATLLLKGRAAYTSARSFTCVVTASKAPDRARIDQISGAEVRVRGAASDLVGLLCIGN